MLLEICRGRLCWVRLQLNQLFSLIVLHSGQGFHRVHRFVLYLHIFKSLFFIGYRETSMRSYVACFENQFVMGHSINLYILNLLQFNKSHTFCCLGIKFANQKKHGLRVAKLQGRVCMISLKNSRQCILGMRERKIVTVASVNELRQ